MKTEGEEKYHVLKKIGVWLLITLSLCIATGAITCTINKPADAGGSTATARYSGSDGRQRELLGRIIEGIGGVQEQCYRIAASERDDAGSLRGSAERQLILADAVESLEDIVDSIGSWIADNYYDYLDAEIEQELGIRIPK
ncbi:MAG: hypothetical protein LBH43_18035 [Treponema sp.]|jgi:hypothetical protein|nr:hypothetical protein [Treponema sp.]